MVNYSERGLDLAFGALAHPIRRGILARLSTGEATVSELAINKAAWDKLPADLQAVVENACAACNVISEAWCQRNNAKAMDDLVKNQGVTAKPLPDAVVKRLREVTGQALAEATAKDALTKKVHDSYMAFKSKYDSWAGYSEAVYQSVVRG